MTKVYLVRHCEAEGNLYRRIHGHYNSSITENGRLQLRALAERFAPIHLDAAYSSDLYRAYRTARAVCDPKHLPITQDPNLREVSMGDWEDRPWAEVAQTDPEQSRNFGTHHLLWTVNGSEGYQKAADRFAAAVLQHAREHDGQTIAIFAHGSVMRTFLCRAHGLTLNEIKQVHHSDNTAVSLVEIDGDQFHILYENDNSHLPESISTLARQSWWKKHQSHPDLNLWFRPMDLETESAFFLSARRDAWTALYQNTDGLDEAGFLQDAKDAQAYDSRALFAAMLEGEAVGILQLEFREGASDDALWIPFFYLIPEYRNQRIGVQLLGQAVSVCRASGRSKLRLRVSTVNTHARHFYEKYGFSFIQEEPGVRAPLWILEKSIAYEE